jgi:hypothetical protein
METCISSSSAAGVSNIAFVFVPNAERSSSPSHQVREEARIIVITGVQPEIGITFKSQVLSE